ncbi:MAG TPA: helix-turn-helix domain-containing protein [Actinospica sp.]|jgi:hypothetical protein|nr:helix-turn-helix domain-containing protein [Actinospica sp.]
MAVARPEPETTLVARIERRAQELARVLAHAWWAEIPDFEELPADMRNLENGRAARRTIRLFLAAMRGEAPNEQEREALLRQGTRLAGDAVPFASVLAAYEVAGRMMFDALRENALPHEQEELLDAVSGLLRANARMTSELSRAYQKSRAYQNEPAAFGSAEHNQRRALVRDLLIGITPTFTSLVEESGLAEGAVVLAVYFADQPSNDPSREPSNDPSREPSNEAPTRPAPGPRAVQDAIERYFGRAVPMLLEADGGHVLVPHALLPAPQGPALDEIAARIGEIRHTARVAAASASSPGGLPAAARTASEVLRLAGRLGRPAGAHRLADVLLEFHLTRRDESADLLDGLLAPLAERPELLETVRVYLEENYDRRRAAQRLSLHPNTVDNRLARTTELTGLDPATPRGVTLLMTALALRDLG